jgi:hypothetical protein
VEKSSTIRNFIGVAMDVSSAAEESRKKGVRWRRSTAGL